MTLPASLAKDANEQQDQEDDENGSDTDVHANPFFRSIRPAPLFPHTFARKPAIAGAVVRVNLRHVTQREYEKWE